MKRLVFGIIGLVLVMVMGLPVTAQDGAIVVAEGLRNPRQMSFDSAGNLYVAEAGVAGAEMSGEGENFGASSQITRISPDGSAEVLVRGLISYRPVTSLGAHAVLATDESLWVLLGESSDITIPFSHALVELDKDTTRVKTWIDILTNEIENDPDGNPNNQSNPTDFAVAPDGTVLIADASCNCLLTWTPADGLQVAVVWPFESDNPVPTSVAVGPDGDIYIGFLTGFPFPQGASRIERWSGGELAETYPGLTGVTDVLVTADGSIYAVEFGESFTTSTGWSTGRVAMVTSNGVETVLGGLTAPYGLAQGPDGAIYVSTNSIGEADGQILRLP